MTHYREEVMNMKQHLFHITRHGFVRICLLTAGLLLVLLTMSRSVQAAPKIYWAEPALGAMRTDPDGSNLEFLGIGAGFDIALDTRASKIYITQEFGDGAYIYRVNQDGSDFETVIDLDLLLSPMYDIALDLEAGKLYWVFGRKLIQRANLDGSAIETLVSLPHGSQVYGLALDVWAGKMYWTNQETNTIQRANLDGTSREDVYEIGSDREPYDIALDVWAGKMYWTARLDNYGYVCRANLDGSDHESLISERNIEPGPIALDHDNGKIIWVDQRTRADSYGHVHGGSVHRADLDGDHQETLVDDLFWDDSTGGVPTGLVVVDMPVQAVPQIYWVEREFRRERYGTDMRIRRGNLDRDHSETLIATHYADDPMPTGAIAVDAILTGKMYWGDEEGIQWANLDGSAIEDLIPTTDPPEAIALDIVDRKIYWTQSDRIQRANLDGTDREDLLTGLNEPCDLALDLLAGKLYWVDAGGALRRANLDGTDEFFIFTGREAKRIALDAQAGVMYMIAERSEGIPPDGDWSAYRMLQVYGYSGFDVTVVELFGLDLSYSYIDYADLVLDLNTSKLYWTEPDIGEIWRSNLDGTDREIARGVRGGFNPRGIALGANVSLLAFPKMYWTDYRTGTIQRANPDGTDVEFLVTTGLKYPMGIALDYSDGKMYWTNYHSPLSEAKIQRADLNGFNVETLVSAGVSGPRGIALDLDAGKMYWTEHITERIRRANLDGSAQETLVNDLPSPVGIALDLDAGKMYWTDNDAGTIQRADLEGTNVEDLVTDLSTPCGIALDVYAGKMYWTDYGSGKIRRANLDGSDVEDLLIGLGEDLAFLALDLDADKIYWTTYDSGRIERANLDGSDPETVMEIGGNNTYGIALLVLPPVIEWMHSPSTSSIRNAVDRMGDTAMIDVYPGDVFSYLMTATNLFDQAMFLTIYDAVDEYLDYVAGTFTVNGVATSDEFFADGILDYQYPDLVTPGQTLEFEFDVIVQDFAPHDWVIENVALITFSLDRPNFPEYAVTVGTNRVEVRVEHPIPEPSTGLFLATGLLVLLALECRRRNTRK
jgi:low density lipoprotein receptor-related protein 5/6